MRSINSEEETGEWSANVWASGAIIQDKLFAFALVGYTQEERDRWGNVTQANNFNDTTETPTWLLKVDWNVNDSNTFELTAFSDKEETESKVYLNDIGTRESLCSLLGTQFVGENGGENFVGKWTSYITDSFNVSALYGHGEFSRGMYLKTPDGTRIAYGGDLANSARDGLPADHRRASAARRDGNGRLREYLQHHRRARQRRQYRSRGRGRYARPSSHRCGMAVVDHSGALRLRHGQLRVHRRHRARGWLSLALFDLTAAHDIVRQQYFNQGTTVEVKQKAFYVEDNWNITDNFLLSVGLRWDSFENINGAGETYVDISNQFGPRLGFSWDVDGDSSLKVYGNAGRLRVAADAERRGARRERLAVHAPRVHLSRASDPRTGAPLGLDAAQHVPLRQRRDGRTEGPGDDRVEESGSDVPG